VVQRANRHPASSANSCTWYKSFTRNALW